MQPENFTYLIQRIRELFVREICYFIKKLADFYLFMLFLNVCKQTFHIISRAHILKRKEDFTLGGISLLH